ADAVRPDARGDAGSAAAGLPPGTIAVPMYANARGDDVQIAHLELTEAQRRAYHDFMRSRNTAILIVECNYDVAHSTWRVKRIRDKKARPNAISTAWHTMEIMAEDITGAELVTRLCPAASTRGAGSGAAASGAPASGR
ncbi:hypothetical protein EON68_02435, partial [archaeon]